MTNPCIIMKWLSLSLVLFDLKLISCDINMATPTNFIAVALKWIYRGEESRWRRNRTGDHFLFYKFIERTTERWTKFTKQFLIASSGHQAPRKAAHCLRREVGQGYWRLKRETRERGTETRPRKGVSIEEVSNHQETLALAGPGEVFKSQRAT